ncbi:TPA: DedA family protein [Candidatus Woesearchaeota archaeon]|nr:DedA family protein [Candidatus Woesearchaeota archaeon]HIG93242.1 DedA family protein [Candidatus Woesearchaeota archaeon]HIH12834.1 DedA family protein [Candidatus Woesearchaeota archaeon]
MHFYSLGLMKRLYLWVLSWADSKYSTLALCILAFTESSFFPIPPDTLQLALSISKPKRSYWYAFLASIFSVLGGILGYFIGVFLFESVGKVIIQAFGYQAQFQQVGLLYQSHAFLAITAAAFTPIPYKVFTIAAGVWKISLATLIAASVVGRSGRFFLVATFTYFMGERVRTLVDKYFNWLSVVLFLLVIMGYAAIKYLT